MNLSERQSHILEIVKEREPITGEMIAEILKVTRAALRADLAILTMSGWLEAKPRVGYSYRGESDRDHLIQLLNQYLVRDTMSTAVVCREDSSLKDAIVMLFMEDVGSIAVVDQNQFLVGIASRKDFLKSALGHYNLEQVPTSVIMTRMPNIVTAEPDETVVVAVSRIVEHEVDSLPVVHRVTSNRGEELKVIGRFSKTNLARLFLDLAR